MGNDICLECWTYTEYCNCGNTQIEEKRYCLTMKQVMSIIALFNLTMHTSGEDKAKANVLEMLEALTND